MAEVDQTLADIREDVAYIRAKIEVLPDFEQRLRVLERFRSAIPSVAVLALLLSGASVALTYIY